MGGYFNRRWKGQHGQRHWRERRTQVPELGLAWAQQTDVQADADARAEAERTVGTEMRRKNLNVILENPKKTQHAGFPRSGTHCADRAGCGAFRVDAKMVCR